MIICDGCEAPNARHYMVKFSTEDNYASAPQATTEVDLCDQCAAGLARLVNSRANVLQWLTAANSENQSGTKLPTSSEVPTDREQALPSRQPS